MSHRRCFLVCLALSALLHAGCEVFVDFDEDALDAGRTVDPVPVVDGSMPRTDAAVRSDAAVVQPAPMDASVVDAAVTDAGDAARDGQASDAAAELDLDAGT